MLLFVYCFLKVRLRLLFPGNPLYIHQQPAPARPPPAIYCILICLCIHLFLLNRSIRHPNPDGLQCFKKLKIHHIINMFLKTLAHPSRQAQCKQINRSLSSISPTLHNSQLAGKISMTISAAASGLNTICLPRPGAFVLTLLHYLTDL